MVQMRAYIVVKGLQKQRNSSQQHTLPPDLSVPCAERLGQLGCTAEKRRG